MFPSVLVNIQEGWLHPDITEKSLTETFPSILFKVTIDQVHSFFFVSSQGIKAMSVENLCHDFPTR